MRAALVPGVLALLPEYAGLDDPVAELRAACLAAVAWLGEPVTVLADPQGARVAAHLLDRTYRAGAEPSYLVVGNGSAKRSEKAPGHLDERAFDFDDELRSELVTGDLSGLDGSLGADLLASLDGLRAFADLLPRGAEVVVDYDDDPFGVQYWVIRWEW